MMRIGILGNGQLGAMLAISGKPLGINFEFLGDTFTETCSGLGTQHIYSTNRAQSIAEFATRVDVLTFESENIDLGDLSLLADHQIMPNRRALAQTQDRLLEKQICRELEIETARFVSVDSWSDLKLATAELGFPCLLKTRKFGYDGKGQWRILHESDLIALRDTIEWKQNGFILEGWVNFQSEISVVGARSKDGNVAAYPITENLHRSGILYKSSTRLNDKKQAHAEKILQKLMRHLDYVGVLTVELFECNDKLLVNEIAPRVHNSGHWTIEGATTSQFENHLRAILGVPLGSTRARGNACMFNIISAMPNINEILATPGAHLHNYQKSARPNRKLGHVTILENDCDNFIKVCEQTNAAIEKSNLQFNRQTK